MLVREGDSVGLAVGIAGKFVQHKDIPWLHIIGQFAFEVRGDRLRDGRIVGAQQQPDHLAQPVILHPSATASATPATATAASSISVGLMRLPADLIIASSRPTK